jgi:hypothetical protein
MKTTFKDKLFLYINSDADLHLDTIKDTAILDLSA